MNRRTPFSAALLAAALAVQPAAAQTERLPDLDEMERSAREALRALQEKVAPYLESLGDAVGALDDYGPPEILPNGDILIPRKRPLEDETAPPAAGADDPPDTIDL